MFPFRQLPLIAALAFATNGYAAPAQEGSQEAQQASPCDKAIQQDGAAARQQRKDADLDGRGACRLADGAVRTASRGNAGVTPSGSFDRDEAEPGRHRFGDDADEHTLRSGKRVYTVDMTTSEGRGAVGFGQARGATDLFGETVDFVAWDGSAYGIPDAPGGRVTTLSDEAYRFIAAPQGADATVPVSTGGALTSRSGGRMADDSAGTGPGLTPAPVPEPSTWAMLAGGLGVLALLRRRR